jgi:hypothetical protein
MFVNGEEEMRVRAENRDEMLSIPFRTEQARRVCALYPNAEFHVVDTISLRTPDGKEDWDAETPLVLKACGYFDAVFGSEPGYAPYFERAYPWAKYEMVDVDRTNVPISATKVRAMKDEKEIEAWIV